MGFFKVPLSGTDKKTKIKIIFLQPFNITNMEIFVIIFYKIKANRSNIYLQVQ